MLEQEAFDLLFNDARTYNGWKDKPVSHEQLKDLYDLVKMGPTSANCCPARFVFVTSDQAHDRLRPHLAAGNVQKTLTAPVTVVVGMDMAFYEKLPQLFPHTDAKSWFVGNQKLIEDTAFRNATLQAGYMTIAARGMGLDVGAMSGFDEEGVTEEFFKGTTIKATLLMNIGHGDESTIFPRSPRLNFDEACEIL